jgi:hypothetical protein
MPKMMNPVRLLWWLLVAGTASGVSNARTDIEGPFNRCVAHVAAGPEQL